MSWLDIDVINMSHLHQTLEISINVWCKRGAVLEIYQIEQQNVEQESVWQNMRKYVEGEALNQQLHEVEKKLFRLLLTLGLSLMKEVIARHNTGNVGSELTMGDGKVLPCRSLKNRQYMSIFGFLEIARSYYWRKGREGCCPLDAKLNLPEREYSYLLNQWVQAGVVEESYEKATAGLSELLGLSIWNRGQQKVTLETSANVRSFYQDKEPPTPSTEGPILCATADCTGVRMVSSEKPEKPKPSEVSKARLGKGEKRGLRRDAVVTADFSFKPEKRTPTEMVKSLMREEKDKNRVQKEQHHCSQHKPRQVLNKQISACMYGKKQAFSELGDRLARRDTDESKPIYVLLDGDPYLEERLIDEFSKRSWQKRKAGVCLDIIHVMEYIWEAATALHGEKGKGRKPWVRKQVLTLLEGGVGRVIGGLKQILTKGEKRLGKRKREKLEKAICYFDNHRHMMAYDEYLEKGYPIATGVIEGACGSFVKDRTDCSGMHWTKAGVQAVLDLRAVKKNKDWDTFWVYHIRHEYERLYGAKAA